MHFCARMRKADLRSVKPAARVRTSAWNAHFLLGSSCPRLTELGSTAGSLIPAVTSIRHAKHVAAYAAACVSLLGQMRLDAVIGCDGLSSKPTKRKPSVWAANIVEQESLSGSTAKSPVWRSSRVTLEISRRKRALSPQGNDLLLTSYAPEQSHEEARADTEVRKSSPGRTRHQASTKTFHTAVADDACA